MERIFSNTRRKLAVVLTLGYLASSGMLSGCVRSSTSRAPAESAAGATPVCGGKNWLSVNVSDPSGQPTAFIRYPTDWSATTLEPGRIQLEHGDEPFQVIVSALHGPTLTDDEVRDLDEQSAGQFAAISPWQRIEQTSTYRLFTITRQAPHTVLAFRYYAGADGIIIVTLETLGALDGESKEQYDRILRCLKPDFASVVI